MTHVASGSLYGLADATDPTNALASAIKPSEFVLKPSGGTQQGTGDILVTAAKSKALGAKVVDRLSDYYPGWPYQFSWSTWDDVVRNELAKVNTKTVPNLAAYAPWNEADNTWNSANGSFEDFWTHTYNLIRSIDKTTPIQGPSFSDNISDMENFLTHAKATNTVPDILAWHELESDTKIQGDIEKVQAIESKLGISPRPIDIEEYASPSEVGIPGDLVGYIAKFERYGIRNAELAFWNQSGTLGDLLTSRGGSPNGAYWLYTWYAQQSGNVVTTTPYSSSSIDGEASLSSDGKELSVIFGGGSSGSSAVQINGISSTLAPGGKVHVKLEQTVNTGRTSASSGPSTVSEGDYSVSGGSLNIPVSTNNLNAYRVVLTPAGSSSDGSTINAGTYTIKNVNSGLVLGVQNMSTSWGASVIQWSDSGTSDHLWKVVAAGNGQYKIQNVNSGLVLGVQNASTSAGAAIVQWGDSGTSDHLWTFVSAGNGQYKIRNVNSGLVLGITNASTSTGATALQWNDSGTSDHLWTLTSH
ncbi:RICIN domain-containing protein [Luteimicrobium xylanilyticum]|uniref:RICIN domain-containing protein n=1 Tax=Luteimicrobium xylanilyticum TaxID=1133546 RepID=UPI001D14F51C|nr:RICIN domain-containing protein [Luteimicrobium xylanilyticum]